MSNDSDERGETWRKWQRGIVWVVQRQLDEDAWVDVCECAWEPDADRILAALNASPAPDAGKNWLPTSTPHAAKPTCQAYGQLLPEQKAVTVMASSSATMCGNREPHEAQRKMEEKTVADISYQRGWDDALEDMVKRMREFISRGRREELDAHAQPSEAEVHEAPDGCGCRCTDGNHESWFHADAAPPAAPSGSAGTGVWRAHWQSGTEWLFVSPDGINFGPEGMAFQATALESRLAALQRELEEALQRGLTWGREADEANARAEAAESALAQQSAKAALAEDARRLCQDILDMMEPPVTMIPGWGDWLARYDALHAEVKEGSDG